MLISSLERRVLMWRRTMFALGCRAARLMFDNVCVQRNEVFTNPTSNHECVGLKLEWHVQR